MGALEPPHTSRLARSALHDRALGPVKHSRNHKPTEEEYKSPAQRKGPVAYVSGRRLVSRISVLPSWVESVYISSVVSPHQPPNKRPMHSVPLWIAAGLYFVTLF